MKTYLSSLLRASLVLTLAFAAHPSRAQIIPGAYINVDWQVGVPLGSSFADKASGWGMNFEAGWFVTENVTVGPFINYQTNIESIGRRTLPLSPNTALTTAQKHTTFQLPFGVASRWNFLRGSVLQPYAGLKLGASYAQFSSYYYVLKQYENSWGFYLQPEVGVSIFPNPQQRFGFHVALYYSYATNGADLLVYSVNSLNNFGVRVGISF